MTNHNVGESGEFLGGRSSYGYYECKVCGNSTPGLTLTDAAEGHAQELTDHEFVAVGATVTDPDGHQGRVTKVAGDIVALDYSDFGGDVLAEAARCWPLESFRD